MEQRMSLITLGVADLQRAAAFYEGVVGWKAAASPPGVVFFDLNGVVFALWPHDELAKDLGLTADDCPRLPRLRARSQRPQRGGSRRNLRPTEINMAQSSSRNRKRLSGAATPAISPTPTPIPGRLPTIPFGRSRRMAACRCRPSNT